MSYEPTQQQQTVIASVISEPIVKVEACAGAGKTSTLVLCAKAVKAPSLYLAFNKVTANEGAAKFPDYVTCKTTHSVAYAACAGKIRHKLERPRGKYVNVAGTGSEIAKYLKISAIQATKDFTIPSNYIGLMAKMTVARFEQSADAELTEEHVAVGDLYEKIKLCGAMSFFKKYVTEMAQKLWAERVDANSVVLATHDTYLKLFQLSKPVFAGYEVLYVDEFQDTTPCVLDIVMNQKPHMKIVMVGDARQAIYGWRGAVNAMLMVDAPTNPLTKSFRYGQAVADVATAVLEGAMVIGGNENLKTVAGMAGFGLIDESQPFTRLFRTNGALLTEAVDAVRAGKKVAIEIDVKDFVKFLESAEALYCGDLKNVKHDKMLAYALWEDAKEESKHDPELKRVVKLIEDGKGREYILLLSNFTNAPEPQVTFTTAHKSKGREWHQVRIEDDFKSPFDEDGDWIGLTTEEQNLLYVACTRAQGVLEYNKTAQDYINLSTSEMSSWDKVKHSLFSKSDLAFGQEEEQQPAYG